MNAQCIDMAVIGIGHPEPTQRFALAFLSAATAVENAP